MVKITKEAALLYHSQGKPGKIEVVPTKPYRTQTDLSLAYSPGVAEPCLEIQKNPHDAYKYTNKGNLVAVISNGTAVLGLGDIGAVSGKPVMEGKSLLFKIYAGVDAFDIEVNEKDPEKFIAAVKAIAPTFGGINLEDIKAPECFEIERRLKAERILYYRLDGSTKSEQRTRLVNAFNENKIPVFLISLKAGGTGLNLTGADIVIHYDPWWNAAAQNQATDRAHRIGQTHTVTVYKLIARHTIEEKILELQENKKTLSDQILSEKGVTASQLTKEELLQILQN